MDVWTLEDDLIVMPGTIITLRSAVTTSVLHRNARRFNLLVVAIAQRAWNESFYKKYDVLSRLCVLLGSIVSRGKNKNFVSSQVLKMSKI